MCPDARGGDECWPYISGGDGDDRDHFDDHSSVVPTCKELPPGCTRKRVSRPIALPKGCITCARLQNIAKAPLPKGTFAF